MSLNQRKAEARIAVRLRTGEIMIYFPNNQLHIDCRRFELGRKETDEIRRDFEESCIGAKIIRTGKSWGFPDFSEIELDNGCVILSARNRDGNDSPRIYDNKTQLEFDLYSILGTDFYYISERRAKLDLQYMKDTNYWELKEYSEVYKAHVCVTPYFLARFMKVVDEEDFVNQPLNWVDYVKAIQEKEQKGIELVR